MSQNKKKKIKTYPTFICPTDSDFPDINRDNFNFGMNYSTIFHTMPITDFVVLNESHFVTISKNGEAILNKVINSKIKQIESLGLLTSHVKLSYDRLYKLLKIEGKTANDNENYYYFENGILQSIPFNKIEKFILNTTIKKFFRAPINYYGYLKNNRDLSFKKILEKDNDIKVKQIFESSNDILLLLYNPKNLEVEVRNNFEPFDLIDKIVLDEQPGTKIIAVDYNMHSNSFAYVSQENNQLSKLIINEQLITFEKFFTITKICFSSDGESLLYNVLNTYTGNNEAFLTKTTVSNNMISFHTPTGAKWLNSNKLLSLYSGRVILFERNYSHFDGKVDETIEFLPEIQKSKQVYFIRNNFEINKIFDEKLIKWIRLKKPLSGNGYDYNTLRISNYSYVFFRNNIKFLNFQNQPDDPFLTFSTITVDDTGIPVSVFELKSYLYLTYTGYDSLSSQKKWFKTYRFNYKSGEIEYLKQLVNVEILGIVESEDYLIGKYPNKNVNSLILYKIESRKKIVKTVKFINNNKNTNRIYIKCINDILTIEHVNVYADASWSNYYSTHYKCSLELIEFYDIKTEKYLQIDFPIGSLKPEFNDDFSGFTAISPNRKDVFIPTEGDKNSFLIYDVNLSEYKKYRIHNFDYQIDFSHVIFETENVLKVYTKNKIIKILLSESKASILGIQYIVFPGNLIWMPDNNSNYFWTDEPNKRYDLIQISRINKFGKTEILSDDKKPPILAAFNNYEIIKAGFIDYNKNELQRLLSIKKKKHKDIGFDALQYKINVLDTRIQNTLVLENFQNELNKEKKNKTKALK